MNPKSDRTSARSALPEFAALALFATIVTTIVLLPEETGAIESRERVSRVELAPRLSELRAKIDETYRRYLGRREDLEPKIEKRPDPGSIPENVAHLWWLLFDEKKHALGTEGSAAYDELESLKNGEEGYLTLYKKAFSLVWNAGEQPLQNADIKYLDDLLTQESLQYIFELRDLKEHVALNWDSGSVGEDAPPGISDEIRSQMVESLYSESGARVARDEFEQSLLRKGTPLPMGVTLRLRNYAEDRNRDVVKMIDFEIAFRVYDLLRDFTSYDPYRGRSSFSGISARYLTYQYFSQNAQIADDKFVSPIYYAASNNLSAENNSGVDSKIASLEESIRTMRSQGPDNQEVGYPNSQWTHRLEEVLADTRAASVRENGIGTSGLIVLIAWILLLALGLFGSILVAFARTSKSGKKSESQATEVFPAFEDATEPIEQENARASDSTDTFSAADKDS
ncbi:MAG: hypothetical protein NUW37_03050 [Planctomycetes bacterium]|nr:hypothetical protein [Planctomycetota bacterium]